MCLRCQGFTEEEVDEIYDLTIRVHGYLLLTVQDPGQQAWTYTVGLSESFGHPDLLCIDIKADGQRQLVSSIGELLAEQGPVGSDELEALDVELVPVHPTHLTGDLVGIWGNRYGRLPDQGEFLQVVPGPSWFCSCHAERVPRKLDAPNAA